MPVLRATLEAVMSSQEKLRLRLDKLAADNKIIETELERSELLKELSYSTLGFGNELIINYPIPNATNCFLLRADVETVIRWLSYEKCSTVDAPYKLFAACGSNVPSRKIEIGKLWEFIRNNLFSVYPLALQHACQMSKEQEGQRKAAGFNIEEKDHDNTI